MGVAGGGVARGGGVVKREAGGAGDRLQKFKALNTKFLTLPRAGHGEAPRGLVEAPRGLVEGLRGLVEAPRGLVEALRGHGEVVDR